MDAEPLEHALGDEERDLADAETRAGDVEGGVGAEEGLARVEGLRAFLEVGGAEAFGCRCVGEDDFEETVSMARRERRMGYVLPSRRR